MPIISFEDAELIEAMKRHYKQDEVFTPADLELICYKNQQHFESSALWSGVKKSPLGFRIQLGRRLSQFSREHPQILRLISRVNNTPRYALLDGAFRQAIVGTAPRSSTMARVQNEKTLYNRMRSLEDAIDGMRKYSHAELHQIRYELRNLSQEVAKLTLVMGTSQPPIGSLSTSEGDRLQTRRLGDPQFADMFKQFGIEEHDDE